MGLPKNSPPNAGNPRNVDPMPGSRTSSGIGNGNPLQYSSLGNPMDRGAWRDMIHGSKRATEHTLKGNRILPMF